MISKQIRRQFILGKQGLWPGRRWKGKPGVAKAIRYMEAVQIDPVRVVAQSHDLVLLGRVDGYSPELLQNALYKDRKFFDYGGLLNIYSMEELPYWRIFMERRKTDKRWGEFAAANRKLLTEMRRVLRDRGPLRNRDLKGQKVSNYRGGKDTSVALYYMWLTGELMTHRREGIERLHDFAENIAPKDLLYTASEPEMTAYFSRKEISQFGVIDLRLFRGIHKGL
ncbi:MAG: winged helix DNA-binding domain-containing protein, partial [Chloroflexota bacterium]